MAIEFEDGVKPEEEIKTLEVYTKQEEVKEQQELEKTAPKADLGDDFKFYVSFLHRTIYNDVFKLGFDEAVLRELDQDIIKIINKRFPNIAVWLEKLAPEMAYIGTFAAGLMIANQRAKQAQEIDKENVKQEINN